MHHLCDVPTLKPVWIKIRCTQHRLTENESEMKRTANIPVDVEENVHVRVSSDVGSLEGALGSQGSF